MLAECRTVSVPGLAVGHELVQSIGDRDAFQFRLYAVLEVALEFLGLGPRRHVEGIPHGLTVVSALNPDRTFTGRFLIGRSAPFLAAFPVIAFRKVAAVERSA
jgi:hypothetical protein